MLLDRVHLPHIVFSEQSSVCYTNTELGDSGWVLVSTSRMISLIGVVSLTYLTVSCALYTMQTGVTVSVFMVVIIILILSLRIWIILRECCNLIDSYKPFHLSSKLYPMFSLITQHLMSPKDKGRGMLHYQSGLPDMIPQALNGRKSLLTSWRRKLRPKELHLLYFFICDCVHSFSS